MSNNPQQNAIQKLDRLPLSARLAALSGGKTLKAPSNINAAAERLGNGSPAPIAWRGVVLAVIDVSGSMSDGPLEQAKRGVVDFAKEAINSRYEVGLIAFGDEAREIVAATRTLSVFSRAALELAIQGSTNMTAGITLAAGKLKDVTQDRVIFLVTDGAPNDMDTTLAAASAAKASGIDIITLGTEGADHDFLRRIASRDTLARNVTTANLQIGIASTARLLLERGGTA